MITADIVLGEAPKEIQDYLFADTPVKFFDQLSMVAGFENVWRFASVEEEQKYPSGGRALGVYDYLDQTAAWYVRAPGARPEAGPWMRNFMRKPYGTVIIGDSDAVDVMAKINDALLLVDQMHRWFRNLPATVDIRKIFEEGQDAVRNRLGLPKESQTTILGTKRELVDIQNIFHKEAMEHIVALRGYPRVYETVVPPPYIGAQLRDLEDEKNPNYWIQVGLVVKAVTQKI